MLKGLGLHRLGFRAVQVSIDNSPEVDEHLPSPALGDMGHGQIQQGRSPTPWIENISPEYAKA